LYNYKAKMEAIYSKINEVMIEKIQEKLNSNDGEMMEWEKEIEQEENWEREDRHITDVFVAPEWYDFKSMDIAILAVWCRHFILQLIEDLIPIIGEEFASVIRELNCTTIFQRDPRGIIRRYLLLFDGEDEFKGSIKFIKSYLETAFSEVL